MFKLHRTKIQNMQFAVYISDTTVTLKQSQGHQTYNDNVDSKQGYNHTEFERSCFNGVQEKVNIKVFFRQGNVNYFSWTCAKIKNSGVYMIYNRTKFQLSRDSGRDHEECKQCFFLCVDNNAVVCLDRFLWPQHGRRWRRWSRTTRAIPSSPQATGSVQFFHWPVWLTYTSSHFFSFFPFFFFLLKKPGNFTFAILLVWHWTYIVK